MLNEKEANLERNKLKKATRKGSFTILSICNVTNDYNNMVMGVSINFLKVCKNAAPLAPSTLR